MRRNIFFILTLLLSFSGIAQSKMRPGLRVAIHVQKTVFSEASLLFYKIKADQGWIINAWGPSIGFENNFRFSDNRFIMAPKTGIEYFFAGAAGQVGLHLIDYIGNGEHDVRLSPEIGATFFLRYNASYSYQVPLGNQELPDVARNKFSMKFNFPRLFRKRPGTRGKDVMGILFQE